MPTGWLATDSRVLWTVPSYGAVAGPGDKSRGGMSARCSSRRWPVMKGLV